MTSLDVVRKVFEISPNVPFFHLEDAYVSLCIRKLGYHLKTFPGFNRLRPKLNACNYKGKWLVTAHYMTPAKTRKMWKAKCHGSAERATTQENLSSRFQTRSDTKMVRGLKFRI